MKELKKILEPLKIKLNTEKWLNIFLWCQIVAFLAILILIFISKFVFVKNMQLICFGFIAVGFMTSVIIAFVKKVTLKETAKAYDSLGMAERFTTALEIVEENKNEGIGGMVVSDAIEKGKAARLEKNYKISFSKKAIKILALIVAFILATGFIKNPEALDVGGLLKTQLKEIEQVKKEINKEKTIEEMQLKEINKEINAITKGIKQASSKKEAIKAMDKAQQQLKKLEKSGSAKALSSISQGLGENKDTKKLSEAIKSGDADAVSKELDKLNQNAQGLSDEELKKLSEALKAAAENITDEELKAATENYASSVASGNLNADAKELQQLKDSLSKSINSSQSVKNAVKDLNELMAKATQAVNNPEAKPNTNDQGTGQGQGQGQGQGDGQGDGQGQGQGSGTTPGGSGRGTGHVETEKIFSREQSNKSGYDTQVQGSENNGGETETEHQQAMGTAGESVPYDQVFGEYKDDALKSLEESTVPYGMKELVADYFSALEK